MLLELKTDCSLGVMARIGVRTTLKHWLETTRWDFPYTPPSMRLLYILNINLWIVITKKPLSTCCGIYWGILAHGIQITKILVFHSTLYQTSICHRGRRNLIELKCIDCNKFLDHFALCDYWCSNCGVFWQTDNDIITHKIMSWTSLYIPKPTSVIYLSEDC